MSTTPRLRVSSPSRTCPMKRMAWPRYVSVSVGLEEFRRNDASEPCSAQHASCPGGHREGSIARLENQVELEDTRNSKDTATAMNDVVDDARYRHRVCQKGDR